MTLEMGDRLRRRAARSEIDAALAGTDEDRWLADPTFVATVRGGRGWVEKKTLVDREAQLISS